MFRPTQPRSIYWRSLAGFCQGEGFGNVDLTVGKGRIVANGISIGDIDGRRFAARFRVESDDAWRTRYVSVETTDGRSTDLTSNGEGEWTGRDGGIIPALAGCIDVDLNGSPYTNTLPIRRLNLTPAHGPVTLAMAFVPFDTFEPYRHMQRYTCLEQDRRYLYENADGSFSAELTVDEDGLVVNYPALFERVYTAGAGA